VYLDEISRGMLRDGDLKRLIDEDGIHGVTSNPAIFEKAIARSSDYDGAIAELAHRDLSLEAPTRRSPWRTSAPPPTSSPTSTRAPTARRATFRSRCRRGSPTTPRARSRRPGACGRNWAGPTCSSRSRARAAGLPAIEQLVADGVNLNVTLLFGLERYAAVADAYLRGWSGGSRPAPARRHRIGRLVLPLAHRRRDRRPSSTAWRSRRPRRRRGAAPAGPRRDRQRQARLDALPGRLRRRPLRAPGRRRRPAAVAAVGVHRHQGPRLPGDEVRRAAHRGANHHHAAARDARRLPRRRATRPCGSPTTSTGRAATSRPSPTSASTSTP
jgi:hypothetical protein